jgi:hypothetical protein
VEIAATTIVSYEDNGVLLYLLVITINNQDQMKSYLYKPLDHSKGEIRLVEVLPGDGLVCVKLHVFPLAEAPPFDALSYTWGQSKCHIIANKAKMQVTHNLLAFLQSIRQCPRVPLLWVDAISINMVNLMEKEYCIRYMPLTYRTATRTLCWTGLEYNSSLRELITTTRQVGNHEEAIAECLSAADILHSTYKVRQSDMKVFQGATTLIDKNTWRNVNEFFNQSYFSRYVEQHNEEPC